VLFGCHLPLATVELVWLLSFLSSVRKPAFAFTALTLLVRQKAFALKPLGEYCHGG